MLILRLILNGRSLSLSVPTFFLSNSVVVLCCYYVASKLEHHLPRVSQILSRDGNGQFLRLAPGFLPEPVSLPPAAHGTHLHVSPKELQEMFFFQFIEWESFAELLALNCVLGVSATPQVQNFYSSEDKNSG